MSGAERQEIPTPGIGDSAGMSTWPPSPEARVKVAEGGFAVVHREKVTDAVGRQWVTGSLDSDVYFTEVRRRAREQAEKLLAVRLERNPTRRIAGTNAHA